MLLNDHEKLFKFEELFSLNARQWFAKKSRVLGSNLKILNDMKFCTWLITAYLFMLDSDGHTSYETFWKKCLYSFSHTKGLLWRWRYVKRRGRSRLRRPDWIHNQAGIFPLILSLAALRHTFVSVIPSVSGKFKHIGSHPAHAVWRNVRLERLTHHGGDQKSSNYRHGAVKSSKNFQVALARNSKILHSRRPLNICDDLDSQFPLLSGVSRPASHTWWKRSNLRAAVL